MSEPTPDLRTERLELVPLAETDADELSIVLADPSLYAFIGGKAPDAKLLRDRFARLVVCHVGRRGMTASAAPSGRVSSGRHGKPA